MVIPILHLNIKKEINIDNKVFIRKKKLNAAEDDVLGKYSFFELFQLIGISPNKNESNDTSFPIDSLEKLNDYEWTVVEVNEEYCDSSLRDVIQFINCGLVDIDIDKLCKVTSNYLLLYNNKNNYLQKYLQSIIRFTKAINKNEPGDQILDITASLESVLKISDELRLRLALIAYQLTKDRDIMKDIYKIYSLRNSYIHSNMIPIVDKIEMNKLLISAYRILEIPLLTGNLFNTKELNDHILDF